MPRILATLSQEDIESLDRIAAREKRSRAALMRDAVRRFLAQKQNDNSWIDRGYGLWADRDDIGDGVEYQRAIREDRRPYEDI